MKKAKTVWTVWACKSKMDYGAYCRLELSFSRRSLVDAADKAADAIRRGDSDSADYYSRKASSLREQTGTTEYYDRYPADYDSAEFSVTFQANTSGDYGPSAWYAGHVGRGDLSVHMARAITKLAKLGCDMSPQDAIAALKARPCAFASGPDEHVPEDISGDLVSPLEQKEAEEKAAENAA